MVSWSVKDNSQQMPTGLDLLFPAAAAQVTANNNRGDFIVVINDEHTSGASRDAAAEMGRVGTSVGLTVISLEVAQSL